MIKIPPLIKKDVLAFIWQVRKQLQEEVGKSMAKASRHKTIYRKNIPLRLKDWEYYSEPWERPKSFPSSIEVVVASRKSVVEIYEEKKNYDFEALYYPTEFRIVYNFSCLIPRFHFHTIEHELMHLSQHLLQEIKKLDHISYWDGQLDGSDKSFGAGLPFSKIKNPKDKELKCGVLSDDEFYPVLNDEIADFKYETKNKYGPKEFRKFVGLESKKYFRKVSESYFFDLLKESEDPSKYKKAIKIAYKHLFE